MLHCRRIAARIALGAAIAALATAGRAAAHAPARIAVSPAPPAQPAVQATDADPGGARRARGGWYGWQLLVVDGAALALAGAVAATAEVEPDPFNVFAATWYGASAVAAPAVHHAHDNWPLGMASFGMRTLAPPVAGFLGLLAACTANGHFDGECARPGWGAGTVVGISGAALIDALLLGYERPSAAPAPRTQWYGWQMLAVDLAGLAGGAIAVGSDRRTRDGDEIHPALGMWAIGFTVGLIGAPIVHFAHGRVGIGFLSLGLRLLVGPLIGVLPGLAGYCAATAGADDCAAHGAQWGLLGGALVASLFDALVLGYEPADADDGAEYAPGAFIGPGTIGVRGYL
jgi:hypothetical protein